METTDPKVSRKTAQGILVRTEESFETVMAISVVG